MSLITTEVRGRVGLITLNDPDKRNAITLAMNDEIGSVLDAWEADEAIGAVVLTGAGRGFCAGADLDDLMAGSNAEEMKAIYEGFLRIAHTPLPTIAAVNGAAVGAGMNMVLACDLVLAGREYAKFDSRFLQIGIHPGGGHTWRLRQIAGRSTTMAMVMFNQILRAERAKEVGLAGRSSTMPTWWTPPSRWPRRRRSGPRTQCPHESHDPHARHDHRVEPGGRLRDPPPAVVDGPAPFMELVTRLQKDISSKG